MTALWAVAWVTLAVAAVVVRVRSGADPTRYGTVENGPSPTLPGTPQ